MNRKRGVTSGVEHNILDGISNKNISDAMCLLSDDRAFRDNYADELEYGNRWFRRSIQCECLDSELEILALYLFVVQLSAPQTAMRLVSVFVWVLCGCEFGAKGNVAMDEHNQFGNSVLNGLSSHWYDCDTAKDI